MSRLLLPLLRSRTAHSLRPLPACRPRGAAGAPALLLRPPPALAVAATALAAAPRPSRGLGTHPKREPIESLNTAQGARDFIYSLHSTERSCLLKELHRFESIAIAQACRYPKPEIALMQRVKQATSTESPNSFGIPRSSSQLSRTSPHSVRTVVMMRVLQLTDSAEKLEAPPPSQAQLRYVFIHNALPFVGFGFLDNAIMIVAGTQIEMSIGIILGISTMAAAALGNLVSDLAGLGLAGYVEALASRLGLSIPDLTPKQVDMWQTRLSAHLGKAVGVAIGCILGMFPLLFFRGEEEEKKLEEKN
ncbi:transmembrane protein 65 isoform X1 [Petaurus breviceps papuanus]|uniref:transmembrane protein 65 isoform X1 n=1 Tax=Petaurus breviceps papuanus TaxID=3040969 RepID=UPI0036DE904B